MAGRAYRHEDELHLAWLRLRCQGLNSDQIGERFGTTGERVRVATQRIRKADLQESGEPQEIVQEAYW